MNITHLYHSGVLIETDDLQIFIDVISDIRSLISDVKPSYFLVTHGHGDHFQEGIFDCSVQQSKFILSDDIITNRSVTFVSPYQQYSFPFMDIRTYGSTDRGLSFMIQLQGITIFHTGDLNWWHWEDKGIENQRQEAQDFQAELNRIEEKNLHVLFAPVDPRLGDHYYLAGEYFLKHFHINHFIPLHFREDFEVTRRFRDRFNPDFGTEIHAIRSRNFQISMSLD